MVNIICNDNSNHQSYNIAHEIIYINDQGKVLTQKEQLTDYKNTFFLNNKIISKNNIWDLYKGINKNMDTLNPDTKLQIGKTDISVVKETDEGFIEETIKICDSYKCEVTSGYFYGNNVVGIARIDKRKAGTGVGTSYAIKIFNLDGSMPFEDEIDSFSRITSAAHFQNKLFLSFLHIISNVKFICFLYSLLFHMTLFRYAKAQY